MTFADDKRYDELLIARNIPFHSLGELRGGAKPGVTTVTSALHGVVRSDPRTRDEFLALVRGGR